MEDELPHELSTITEVDTPATSRLNATDLSNVNDNTLKNAPTKITLDDEILKLLYKEFPNFKEYIQSNPTKFNISMASMNDTDVTAVGLSAILDEKLGKVAETCSSRADELKYKAFAGEDQRPSNDRMLEDSDLRMSYSKFPSHADYAKSVPGLLDSQSIDQLQISDGNENSVSSLPDIVNELKSRQILEHSFEEAADKEGDLDDLLLNHGNPKPVSAQTTESRNQDESLSDVLENDLNSMGLSWVTAEMKKSKAISISTSISSDSSNHAEHSRRSSATKQLLLSRPKTAKRTYQRMNQSKATNDSFVDKNLLMAKHTMDERTVSTQATDEDHQEKSIKLKEFLARELLKHSSMSSSSDSSLASIFLKSLLGHSSTGLPETPQNRGTDKHRTSTPIDHSSDSKGGDSSKKYFHSSSVVKSSNMNTNDTASPTFFANESQLSSVRMSTTDSTQSSTSCDDRRKFNI